MPAVELAPVGETVPAAELAPSAALLPAAAASDDSLIAVPRVTAVKIATFQDNDGIELRGWSAPEYPGYHMSTPTACLLHTSTCYLLSQAAATPGLPCGSKSRALLIELTLPPLM